MLSTLAFHIKGTPLEINLKLIGQLITGYNKTAYYFTKSNFAQKYCL